MTESKKREITYGIILYLHLQGRATEKEEATAGVFIFFRESRGFVPLHAFDDPVTVLFVDQVNIEKKFDYCQKRNKVSLYSCVERVFCKKRTKHEYKACIRYLKTNKKTALTRNRTPCLYVTGPKSLHYATLTDVN